MNQEFWWNWWIQFGVTAGTFGAVITALWAAMRKPDRPLLKLEVLRKEGERTVLNSGEDVRYYHLKVWNGNRSTPLQQGSKCILRFLRKPTNSTRKTVWCGAGIYRFVGVIRSLFHGSKNS